MKINNLNVVSNIQNLENKSIRNKTQEESTEVKNNDIKNYEISEREQKIIDIKNKIKNNEYPKLDLKDLSKVIVNELF